MTVRVEDEVKPEDLADEIMKQARFITFMDDDEVWSYAEGIYVKGGEALVKAAIEKAVRGATTHFAHEVIGHIKRRTYIRRDDVDLEWYLVALSNGVLDLRDGSFHEHSPDRILVNKLPVKFDRKAKCPAFLKFLSSAQENADARTRLMDHFAACLDRRPKKRRALLCIGEKDTGKSTFLQVVEAFLGPTNISNVPLQQLCGEDKFAAAQLYGKMSNIYADLSVIVLKQLGQFKALTGGDWLSAQAKHKDLFKFRPHVKLLFSTNKPADVKDITDDAFFSRWDVVYWKRQWKTSEQDKDLESKLTTPEELSGILNMLIGYVQRQIRTGRMHFESSAVEVRYLWLYEAEPSRNFLKEAIVIKMDSVIKRADLYGMWNEWRKKRETSHVSETRFNELVIQSSGAKKTTKKIGGKATEVWLGIALAPSYSKELEAKDGQRLLASPGPPSPVGEVGGISDFMVYCENIYIKEEVEKSANITNPETEALVLAGFRRIFGGARPVNGNGHAKVQDAPAQVAPTTIVAPLPPAAPIAPPKPKAELPTFVCSVEGCGIILGQSGLGAELSIYKIGKDRFCKKHFEERRKRGDNGS